MSLYLPVCDKIISESATLTKLEYGDENVDSQPRNIVHFVSTIGLPHGILLISEQMPYLHWDLDRQRKNFTSLIEKRAFEQERDQKKIEEFAHYIRRRERHEVHHHQPRVDQSANQPPKPLQKAKSSFSRHMTHLSNTNGKPGIADSVADIVHRVMGTELRHQKKNKRRQLDRGQYGRLRIKNKLGQFLYDSVKLFEVMDNFRDRKLLSEYLLGNPPLHPRRTLDQAYYSSLRNTMTRDRDQVVYRQTSTTLDHLHHYDPEGPDGKKWDCHERDFRVGPNPSPTQIQERQSPVDIEELGVPTTRNGRPSTSINASSPRHSRMSVISEFARSSARLLKRFTPPDIEAGSTSQEVKADSEHQNHSSFHRECVGCRESIQKLPRLIMVDQLWMWILDDETIITCFPRRYGVNRKDASGVHKLIRTRISNRATGKIKSAFDIALIIIDECSSVFFDRTKTDERQPEVINIFAEAISKMASIPQSNYYYSSTNLNKAQKQTMYFHHLWYWAGELANASTKKSSLVDLSLLHTALLNITAEGQLQRETKDIIEELRIMIYIVRKQKEVIKRFKRHAEGLLDHDGCFKNDGFNDWRDSRNTLTTRMNEITQTDNGEDESTESNFTRGLPDNGSDSQHGKWKTFRANADELLEDTDERLDELETLHRNAEDVCKDVSSQKITFTIAPV